VNEELFKARTRKLALDIIGLVESLPRSRTADVIGRQLLRSGTSIGANYRAACRGKSKGDVIYLSSRLLRRREMRPSTGWSCS
jgi:four helix bundle protein